jgi:hypothetical protein
VERIEEVPPLEPETQLDVMGLARRVVAGLHPAAELKEDLVQQAVVLSFDLLQRFRPRSDPGALTPREQAERYLFVSLQWHLRAYSRRLRSSVSVPESDRRLANAYNQLVAVQGSLSIDAAAAQLGVKPKRLAEALAGRERAISLDQPGWSDDEDVGPTLEQRVADADPGPEQQVVASVDDAYAAVRQSVLGQVLQTTTEPSSNTRRRQTRSVLYLLLEQLRRGDAEILRLAFALPRKEIETLRSCRTYGCRQETGHEHGPGEIARWLQSDPSVLARRLEHSLDDLEGLLGGRDPRRLLGEVSANVGTSGGGIGWKR